MTPLSAEGGYLACCSQVTGRRIRPARFAYSTALIGPTEHKLPDFWVHGLGRRGLGWTGGTQLLGITLARGIGLTAACFALGIGGAIAATAPKISVANLDKLPIVVAKPYDTSADADAAVNAALAKARTSGKRVLIDLGGNWCPDCIILANIMRLPEVAPFISAHYEVVMVDVGRFNRNLQVPARFGFTHRLEGVPFMLVVDPTSGKLLNTGNTATLDEAHGMEPQAIVDRLASWAE